MLDVVQGKYSSLAKADLTSFFNLYTAFQKLKPGLKQTISLALARLGQAKGRTQRPEAALDLGIALEMILLNSDHKGDELPGQLHNQFRLRGAWLIGDTFEERSKIFKLLRDVYTMRSQMAHAGILKSADKIRDPVHFSALLDVAEKIFRKLILDGPPSDWSQLTLGSKI
tara:strand:+ start:980 stop:1489 length:510 start_codon:yes stop_codon:yes gene_type:complete